MNKTTKKLIMILMAVIILGSTGVVPAQTAQAKAVKTNGYYLAVAVKSMKNMLTEYPILKKVNFKKNKFASYGGFLYYTDSSFSVKKEKTMKNQKRTFPLSKKCKYLLGNDYESYFAGDDMSSTKSISKEKFIKKVQKRIKKDKPHGDLIIQVKGKQIVQMFLQTW